MTPDHYPRMSFYYLTLFCLSHHWLRLHLIHAWSYLLGTARREIVRSKVLYAVR